MVKSTKSSPAPIRGGVTASARPVIDAVIPLLLVHGIGYLAYQSIHADERILIHTTGLVTQDVAICHYLYEQAKAKGMGITLPAARPPA